MSEVAWRLPGWPARFTSSFRETERGSAVDMLAAAELTDRRDLRKKYFLHALDETRHAALFHERSVALGGGTDRAHAAIEDAGTLQTHGIIEGKTMFERFGELEFLAFVFVAEAEAVEQFHVYRDRNLPDPETLATLNRILKDEHFHVSYSRAELERYRKGGRDAEVTRALRSVRWRRLKEAWLRFSVRIGSVVSNVWLVLLYLIAIAPFRLFARIDVGGWHPVQRDRRPMLAMARSQG